MAKLNRIYKRAMLKYQLKSLLYTLLYWNIAIRLSIFMRMLGARADDISDVLTKGMEFVIEQVIWSSAIISLFAIFSWFTLNFLYPQLIQKYKIRRLTAVMVLFDLSVFAGIGILLGIVHYSIDYALSFSETISKMGSFLFNSTSLFFLLVMFIWSYVYQLMNTLLHQIGYAPLGRIMVGYYQKPREEEHIFMFLDLQSSTSSAEKLGHNRYSYFIQDCFRCVSAPLLATGGRVYQFVGDEVVVTWDARKLKNFKSTVDFFCLYEEALEKRRSYFESEYGFHPVFTASINVGKVMAAEVGEVKRELAFHGDVLNTAARIQKQCKPYKKQILVTDKFAESLQKLNTEYQINYVDEVKFHGKNRMVKLFEVHRNNK